MFTFRAILLSLLSATTILSTPLPLTPRQASSGASCGSDNYSTDDIAAAVSTGCSYLQNGQTVGRNHYPHSENNYEGLAFVVDGPYWEFPVMADGSLFDGSEGPGPDRVVFDAQCELAGTVTHTGAGGENFLLCAVN